MRRLIFAAAIVSFVSSLACAGDWPCFRGVNGNGSVSVEDARKLPAEFDAGGKLILWKTELGLEGESSPIVAGGKIFLTGADEKNKTLYCYDAANGKLLWKQNIAAGGKNPGEPGDEPPTAGLAAPTAATDGKIVVTMFGNGDVAAFDFEGKQLWSRGLGLPESGYGFASSPIVHGSSVFIQYDQGTGATEAESSIFSLDIATGKTKWQTKRTQVHASWTTPVVVKAGGAGAGEQLITVSNPWVIAYELSTGAEIWKAKCMGNDCAPSAAFADGVVYTALVRNAINAIKIDGKGDVTNTHLKWKNEDDTCPEVASPATDGKVLFLALDRGMLTGHSLADGKKLWEIERDTEFRSSPTLVGEQFWVFDRKGVLYRVSADGKVIGTWELGEKTDAQPAYVGGRIYVRGKKHLICIGK
jgi:outer membrane protein assembly factor BamB